MFRERPTYVIIKIPVVVEGLQGMDIAYAGISFGECRYEKTIS